MRILAKFSILLLIAATSSTALADKGVVLKLRSGEDKKVIIQMEVDNTNLFYGRRQLAGDELSNRINSEENKGLNLRIYRFCVRDRDGTLHVELNNRIFLGLDPREVKLGQGCRDVVVFDADTVRVSVTGAPVVEISYQWVGN